jgi:phosphoglycolate phosphatase-like HAD superfamily hydrolase
VEHTLVIMYNIFLDFDGVIGDTIVEHATACKEIFKSDLSVDQIINTQFRKSEYGPKADSKQLIFDFGKDNSYEKFVELTTKQCDMVIKMDFKLFDRFVETISNIKSKKVAIVSNSSRAVIDFALTKLAVHGLKIDTISTIEDGASKADRIKKICKDWKIKTSEIYFVTDTTYDIKEAQEFLSNDQIVAVSWGYHSYQKLNTVISADQILMEEEELYRVIGLESAEVFAKNIDKKIKKTAKQQAKIQKEADAIALANILRIADSEAQIEEEEIDEDSEAEDLESGSEEEFDNDYEWIDTEIDLTKKYTLLDSTGIRRPGQRTFGAESFATFQTIEAAYKADVICMVVDGSQPITHQDQVVAGIIKEAKKGVVVIINKADLVNLEQREEFLRDFNMKFAFLKVKKFVWVSAKNSRGLDEIWTQIDGALEQKNQEISREETRKIFNYLMKQKPPKKLKLKKRPIVYDLIYSNKNGSPLFELLCKDKTAIHWSYIRFLENTLRKNFNFENTEIKVKAVNLSKQQVLAK